MSMISQGTLGRKLRASRASIGFDQQQIADVVGVARSTVSGWERGDFEPTASKLFAWARVTNQPLDWFAEGLDSDGARLEGLEPPTFWLVVDQLLDDEALVWPEATPIHDSIACQLWVDTERANPWGW